MEAKAQARHVRVTPMKARRVVDLIRGKQATEAIAVLQFAPQAASEPVLKVLESAIANARVKADKAAEAFDERTLVISEAYVDEGATMNRFIVAPSSTYASLITSVRSSNASAALSAFTRAFAMALSSTLRTGSLAACGANCNTAIASVACLPRIRSTTRRAFMGVTRTCRACALASIAVPCFRSKLDQVGVRNPW